MILFRILILGMSITLTYTGSLSAISRPADHSRSVAASQGVWRAHLPVLNRAKASSQAADPQLAWFYKPPADGNLRPLKDHFSRFILTRNDEEVRNTLRASGAPGPFLQYMRFEAIQDPGSCTAQPWRNQVADRPGDFCNIQANHPDWFLRDAGGTPIVEVEGDQRFYLMDPGNAGWRAFWLERARQGQEQFGWDGVFLDNVEAGLSKRIRNGARPARYPDDASYQLAIQGFLAEIYQGYFKPQRRPLYGNIIALADPAVWFRYLKHLDGAMEEGWAVDWSSGYLSLEAWQEHLSRVERTQALGKQAILVSQGQPDNVERQKFTYASYLLVNNGAVAFRYSDDSAYRSAWIYDTYNLDLGAPLGPRYRSGNLWKRDFAKGSVTVDPLAHTAHFSQR